jgi:hypothetical protein
MPQMAALEPSADGPLTVATVLYLGTHREIRLSAPRHEIMVTQPIGAPLLSEGTRANLRIDPVHLHAYSPPASR